LIGSADGLPFPPSAPFVSTPDPVEGNGDMTLRFHIAVTTPEAVGGELRRLRSHGIQRQSFSPVCAAFLRAARLPSEPARLAEMPLTRAETITAAVCLCVRETEASRSFPYPANLWELAQETAADGRPLLLGQRLETLAGRENLQGEEELSADLGWLSPGHQRRLSRDLAASHIPANYWSAVALWLGATAGRRLYLLTAFEY
jgi:hypothetical protein